MAKKPAPIPDAGEMLQLLSKANKPLNIDGILRHAGLTRRAKKDLQALLAEMGRNNEVLCLRGGSFMAASSAKVVTGHYIVQRSGTGFVTPDSDKITRQDIYVHPTMAGEAWHGDLVRAALMPGRRSGKFEGRIIEIIERRFKRIAAYITGKHGDGLECRPADPRHDFTLLVNSSDFEAMPARGDLILIEPVKNLAAKLWQGKGLAALGKENSVAAQEQVVKAGHQAPSDFPPKALAEAASLPQEPRQEDWSNRKNWMNLPFVTIDGADAKDFDDAVMVRKTPNGFALYVAIADVSHYVRPGSALDKEALSRGNSWYFPSSVEPMLPESLSNGLCSLKPGVSRLAFGMELLFDEGGLLKHSEFSEVVISSKARLTYEQVGALLEENEDIGCVPEQIKQMLLTAGQLSAILSARRKNAGALDFDLPEAEYEIDKQGNLLNIKTRVNNKAHVLIENFMVAANEAVAAFIADKKIPLLFRTHPEPDEQKIVELFKRLAASGLAIKLSAKPSAKDLPGLLSSFKGDDQEFLVGRMALRSMPKASYSPLNSGHFGLGSSHYCHFTSPIRRYADLVAHRALKFALGLDPTPMPRPEKLLKIADAVNGQEIAAAEAEREMLRRMAVLILSGREGEIFSGIISAVNDFGFFVLLKAMPVEGMVRVESLADDLFEYDPKSQELIGFGSGLRFSLGMNMEVKLVNVDKGRLEINFELAKGGTRGHKATKSAGRIKAKKSTRLSKPRKYSKRIL